MENITSINNSNCTIKEDKLLTKYKAITMFKEGRSKSDISKELGIYHYSLSRWIKKYEEVKDLNIHRPRSGRPKKIYGKIEQGIVNRLKKKPYLTLKQLSREVIGIKKVSPSTIGKFLSTKGNRYKPSVLYPLTDSDKLKRKLYAEKLLKINLNKVIFSDETKFELNRYKRRFFRFKGEQRRSVNNFNPNYSISYWGAISVKGKISLVEYSGRMNSLKYLEIMQNNLLPEASSLYPKENYIFQQDNAKYHTSKLCLKWFEEKKVNMLDHPAKSPDLNPIESIWGIMKHRVEQEAPRNKSELRSIVNEVWRELNKETLKNTVYHIKKVAANVVSNNGEYEDKYFDRKGRDPVTITKIKENDN